MSPKNISSKFLALILICLLCSCSTKSYKEGDPVFTDAGSNYEVESISDQLTQELEKYPTRFVLPVSAGKESLERAFFFFKTYTTSFAPKSISATARNISLSSERSKDWALYRVSRVLTQDGFRYSVAASVANDPRRSSLLAANLARFIKDSNLEVSLLSKQK